MINNRLNIIAFNSIDANELAVSSSMEEIIYSLTGSIPQRVSVEEKGIIGFMNESGEVIAYFDRRENCLEIYVGNQGYRINNILPENDKDIALLHKIFQSSFEITKIPQDDGSILFVDANRNIVATKRTDGVFEVIKPDGSIEYYSSSGTPFFDNQLVSFPDFDPKQNIRSSSKRFSNNSKVYVDPLTDPVMKLLQMSLEVRINENGEKEYYDAFGEKVATLLSDGRIAIYLPDGSVEYYGSNGQPIGAELTIASQSVMAEKFEEVNHKPVVQTLPEPKTQKQEKKTEQTPAKELPSKEGQPVAEKPVMTESRVSDLEEPEIEAEPVVSIAVSDNVEKKKTEDVPAEIAVDGEKETSLAGGILADSIYPVVTEPEFSSVRVEVPVSTDSSIGTLSVEGNIGSLVYNSNLQTSPIFSVNQSVLARIMVCDEGLGICLVAPQGISSTQIPVDLIDSNRGSLSFVERSTAGIISLLTGKDTNSFSTHEKSSMIFMGSEQSDNPKSNKNPLKLAISLGNGVAEQSDKTVEILGFPFAMTFVNRDFAVSLASSDTPKGLEGDRKVAEAQDRGHGRDQQNSDDEGRRGSREEYVVVLDDEEDNQSLSFV